MRHSPCESRFVGYDLLTLDFRIVVVKAVTWVDLWYGPDAALIILLIHIRRHIKGLARIDAGVITIICLSSFIPSAIAIEPHVFPAPKP